ncbi:MAG: hypothetical protein JKZ00_03525, partial [Flavobacteriaceae bacterium]|nr:hypothetical protein [Flavobacteriaceae bacterium]
KFNFFALVKGIHHIAISSKHAKYKSYFSIPNNVKNFYDIIECNSETGQETAYQFKNEVIDSHLITTKKLVNKSYLSNYNAHQRINIKK